MNADQPRVLQIVPQLFGLDGLFGGAERYALELSRAMARRTPTRLVAFGPAPQKRAQGPLSIFTITNQLPAALFSSSPASLALWPHLRWADVVHCHQTFTMATSMALLYGRIVGTPVFTTDHGGGGPCLNGYFRRLDDWFAGHLWVSRFSQGANPIRSGDAIIWGGVDPDQFVPAASSTAESGPVLFVGRRIPAKGAHTLLAAVDASTDVVILGPVCDPAYEIQLLSLARGKNVQFLRPVEGAALTRAYQSAICVVLPGTETLGLTLLEAMACARPVICTAHSGMPELIADGVNGMIVPPDQPTAIAERIAWLRANPARARAMGQLARECVLKAFTWDAVAERCLTAYRRLDTRGDNHTYGTSVAENSSRAESKKGGA